MSCALRVHSAGAVCAVLQRLHHCKLPTRAGDVQAGCPVCNLFTHVCTLLKRERLQPCSASRTSTDRGRAWLGVALQPLPTTLGVACTLASAVRPCKLVELALLSTRPWSWEPLDQDDAVRYVAAAHGRIEEWQALAALFPESVAHRPVFRLLLPGKERLHQAPGRVELYNCRRAAVHPLVAPQILFRVRPASCALHDCLVGLGVGELPVGEEVRVLAVAHRAVHQRPVGAEVRLHGAAGREPPRAGVRVRHVAQAPARQQGLLMRQQLRALHFRWHSPSGQGQTLDRAAARADRDARRSVRRGAPPPARLCARTESARKWAKIFGH